MRRRRPTKRPGRKSKKAFKKFAKKILNAANEKKFFVTTINEVTIDNLDTGVTIPGMLYLNPLNQGDDVTNRDGAQVQLRSLDLFLNIRRLPLTYDPATNVQVCQDVQVRFLVWQWLDDASPAVGAAPLHSALDVLFPFGVAAPLSTTPTMFPYSHVKRYSFRVLYDRTWTLGVMGDTDTVAPPITLPISSGTQPNTILKHIRIRKFAQRRLVFQTATGVSSSVKNGLFCTLVTNAITPGSAKPVVWSLISKMNFTDA